MKIPNSFLPSKRSIGPYRRRRLIMQHHQKVHQQQQIGRIYLNHFIPILLSIHIFFVVVGSAFRQHAISSNIRHYWNTHPFVDLHVHVQQVKYNGIFSRFGDDVEAEDIHFTHSHDHEHIMKISREISTDALPSNREQQFQEFQSLLHQVMMTEKPEHLPGLLGRNIQTIMSIQRDQIECIVSDALQTGGIAFQEQVTDALEIILGFAETFVDEMKSMNDEHKELLGRILHAAKVDEDTLDELLEQEIDNLTPGFIRHLEGECQRIANAAMVTAESTQLLQVLQTIRLRVIEELGKTLGDEAIILGQLLGYDDPNERMAVLQAGLNVRGINFAKNLWACTEQVVSDFDRIGIQNTDPELVGRVQEIYKTVGDHIKQQQQ
jgi:hypothetical protein